MLLGGYVGDESIVFGQKALRLPAKSAPEAVANVVSQFAGGRKAGEPFSEWLIRSGGAGAIADTLRHFDVVPTPDEAPDYYVDFDETGPYVAEVAESECAT